MAERSDLPRLQELLTQGRIDELRAVLLGLDDSDRALLEAELGADATRRLFRSARRRRGPRLGRVVVINGIMGALLDVIKGGDRDRVWVHYWRLMRGRIRDLKLKANGEPADPAVQVAVGGLHKTYLPLVLELDQRWHVLPFGFDWRQDIRLSARRLAEEIGRWAGGEPVHLVAHSMGGLVSRHFMRSFPDLWRSMLDPAGRRGGRLVMLGTPNRGAYVIPLLLTGEEKIVKTLALLDLSHRRGEFVQIVGTFPGNLQMLPSPRVSLDDDHVRLFRKATWGTHPATQAFLDDASRFHDELHPVLDRERLIYVAGYDQKTPHRIRVVAPGKFEYQTTPDGDGRVPHELGLLDGVRTLWVREEHGSLPKNASVLQGIHELLLTGTTSELEVERPGRRGAEREARWQAPGEFEVLPAGLEEVIAETRKTRGSRGKTARAPRADADSTRLEALLVADYLGATDAPGARAREEGADPRPRGRLNVEVVWGDITLARGDVYCVGHYRGVLPQYAEKALDEVVSLSRSERARWQRYQERLRASAAGKTPARPFEESRFVLQTLARRGVLRGGLGDINLYPWADARDRHRIVAVAGMGHPGTFDAGRLRELAAGLAWTVGCLPGDKTICTVLIGSGEGSIAIEQAAASMIRGVSDAVGRGLKGSLRRLCLVERSLSKAHDLHDAVRKLAAEDRHLHVKLAVKPRVTVGRGGAVTQDHGLALALAAAARAAKSGRVGLTSLLRHVPTASGRREGARTALQTLARKEPTVETLARRLHVGLDEKQPTAIPTRIAFTRVGNDVRVAAISRTAVVSERQVGTDFELIRELTELTTDPQSEGTELQRLGALMNRRLVPRDFRDLVSFDSPKIFEVDRDMATVHWELLATETGEMLGVFSEVARQLRTTYSPPPEVVWVPGARLRALVVGDPGDPEQGDDLPGARREAEQVADLFEQAGIDTWRRIGPPRKRRAAFEDRRGPASRLEVLRLLDAGSFDLLHYCGHGDFDPADPTSTGWVFSDGLLTARALETVDRAPRLVVANACLSARTSRVRAGGEALDDGRSEAGLLPSLADEFLRRGVHNYVGTSWEVDDEGAILFARTLYRAFLGQAPAPRAAGSTNRLGAALLAARQELHKHSPTYGSLWLAYQHYGDPDFRL